MTGEQITAEALGGPDAHMAHSGVIHFIAENDQEALYLCRRLLSFLPSNNLEDPPRLPSDNNVDPNPELNRIVPVDRKQGYDVREVIGGDRRQRRFPRGAGRLRPRTSSSASPASWAGRSASSPTSPRCCRACSTSTPPTKASRFIRFCNAFNIPLVTFVDVPGFLPGVQQEHGGIIRHGAKMLFAYSAATVPKIQVILRKSYGGAHLAMCSKDLGADRVFAWPTAEVAVMGAEGAVEIVFRKEMEEATDKAARRAELIEQYRSTFSTPYVAAGRRLVDDIIEPADTRKHLAQALEYLQAKRDVRPAQEARPDPALTGECHEPRNRSGLDPARSRRVEALAPGGRPPRRARRGARGGRRTASVCDPLRAATATAAAEAAGRGAQRGAARWSSARRSRRSSARRPTSGRSACSARPRGPSRAASRSRRRTYWRPIEPLKPTPIGSDRRSAGARASRSISADPRGASLETQDHGRRQSL